MKKTVDSWINREAGFPDVDHSDPTVSTRNAEKRVVALLNERLPTTRVAPLASHLTPDPGVKVHVEVVTDLVVGKIGGRRLAPRDQDKVLVAVPLKLRSGPRVTTPVAVSRTSDDMRVSARFLAWYGRTLVQRGTGGTLAASEEPTLRSAGLRAIEDRPYIVEVRGSKPFFRGFRRGDEAIRFARSHSHAEVSYVSMRMREIVGSAQTLPRPDRARGPSSVLQGQGTKVVRHFVATHLTEVRVY